MASEQQNSEAPVVRLENVNKHYGDLHVLKDVNLTVRRGEVLVVIGPSGSGKSTMIRTINRLETIDSGCIEIEGQPLPQEGKELAAMRAEVGSSKSIALGCIANERAMATRCCWPPESWAGTFCACSATPTRRRSSIASAFA